MNIQSFKEFALVNYTLSLYRTWQKIITIDNTDDLFLYLKLWTKFEGQLFCFLIIDDQTRTLLIYRLTHRCFELLFLVKLY